MFPSKMNLPGTDHFHIFLPIYGWFDIEPPYLMLQPSNGSTTIQSKSMVDDRTI